MFYSHIKMCYGRMCECVFKIRIRQLHLAFSFWYNFNWFNIYGEKCTNYRFITQWIFTKWRHHIISTQPLQTSFFTSKRCPVFIRRNDYPVLNTRVLVSPVLELYVNVITGGLLFAQLLLTARCLWDSSMLLCVTRVYSLSLLCWMPQYGYGWFVYSFSCWWTSWVV